LRAKVVKVLVLCALHRIVVYNIYSTFSFSIEFCLGNEREREREIERERKKERLILSFHKSVKVKLE
jgi:hypothetical protein